MRIGFALLVLTAALLAASVTAHLMDFECLAASGACCGCADQGVPDSCDDSAQVVGLAQVAAPRLLVALLAPPETTPPALARPSSRSVRPRRPEERRPSGLRAPPC